MSRIVILGCGPSGLLAAHACARAGESFEIVGPKTPSSIHGAQYLHAEVPGITLTNPDRHVQYLKRGTREGYAQKVYGSPDAPCSWDKFDEGRVPAWSLLAAYKRLWRLYDDQIVQRMVGQEDLFSFEERGLRVISTMPLTALCDRHFAHERKQQEIWITDGIHGDEPVGNGDIVYSGDPDVPWYRASNLFDHEFTEWTVPPPLDEYPNPRVGVKPISTDCNCHPGIFRAGRFGKWEKQVLLHDAFADVTRGLECGVI